MKHSVDSIQESDELIASVKINVCIFVILLFLFTVLRMKYSLVYSPRLEVSSDKRKPRPPPLLKSYFAWIIQVYNFNDDEMLKYAG